MRHLIYLPILVLLSAWAPITERCGPPEMMHCTSAGLISEPMTGAIVVAADVRVTPASDGRFWAGLALNGDVAGDGLYAQAAITDRIMPYREPYAPTGGPAGVGLVAGGDHCCRIFGQIDPSATHHLSVAYDGSGSATMCVDGACDTARISLGPSYVVELLCVGVDPGEPGQNVVGCTFTSITIEQPGAPAPPIASPAPLPSAPGMEFW